MIITKKIHLCKKIKKSPLRLILDFGFLHFGCFSVPFILFILFFMSIQIPNCPWSAMIIMKKPLLKYQIAIDASFNFFAFKGILIVSPCF
jgi:hypothetical protein